MSSLRCPQCNLVNWASEICCKRCGFSFRPLDEIANSGMEIKTVADPSLQQTPNVSPMVLQPEHHSKTDSPIDSSVGQTYQPKPPKQKAGLALFSMILGIIGLPPFCSILGAIVGGLLAIFFGVPGFIVGLVSVFAIIPFGLVTGIIAFRRSNIRPNEFAGKGYATAGIVCSSVALFFTSIIALIAIPNVMAARRTANEGRAISTVRKIAEAENAAFKNLSTSRCSDLKGLVRAGFVEPEMEKGEMSGYRYQVVASPAGGCEVYAMPMSALQGNRSFYYSTIDGVIRSADKNGSPADKHDPPVGDSETEARPTMVRQERS